MQQLYDPATTQVLGNEHSGFFVAASLTTGLRSFGVELRGQGGQSKLLRDPGAMCHVADAVNRYLYFLAYLLAPR